MIKRMNKLTKNGSKKKCSVCVCVKQYHITRILNDANVFIWSVYSLFFSLSLLFSEPSSWFGWFLYYVFVCVCFFWHICVCVCVCVIFLFIIFIFRLFNNKFHHLCFRIHFFSFLRCLRICRCCYCCCCCCCCFFFVWSYKQVDTCCRTRCHSA